MGKASRTKQAPDRRARVAAQREAARRAEQRKRIYIAGGSILAVIIVVIAFVLVKQNSGGPAAVGSNGPTGAALTSVINQTTSVPAATLDKVGAGSAYSNAIIPITSSQQPLTSGNKPEMLYVGAEYCPYCAAERWAMVVALSRFGTFSGLSTVHSASVSGSGSQEPFPNTSTWTFANAKYTSNYLTFTPVEQYSNVPDSSTGGYKTLQNLTKDQQALVSKFDAPPYVSSQEAGSIPFVNFGNKYLIVGASYDPQVLAGKTWAQISAALHDPTSPITKAIGGTANYITAAICKLTGNQPATACTPAVQALQSKF
ncbi:MAG TPA: DUF929 family protein [Trebonia sp.]|jgi:hypothetical protein